MSKVGYIYQIGGLGDIIFCQKLAFRALSEFNCEKVFWPVTNVYNYIGEYIHQENVIFQDESQLLNRGESIINDDDLLYIPLQNCNVPVGNDWAHGYMKYKFFFDTDFSDWKSYFELRRNFDREKKLMETINVDFNKPFNFINRNFGSPPGYITNTEINVENGNQNVYMEIKEGFNIFDWIGIIEMADEIHIMESSLYYILEKLNIEDNVYIYSKYKYLYKVNDDYSYMRSHCSKKWNYM